MPTAVSDSLVFRNIFATPESNAVWSDERRTGYYLEFEKCLAQVQAELGIKACDIIVQHCTLDYIDWDELRKQTELIGYPVLPVVKQLVKGVNDVQAGLGEWAHWGATTQDVTDTATVLQIRDTLDLISTILDDIIASSAKLADKHKNTPMAARSNLQQAVPITFGFKMARLLATFRRHRQRLAQLRERVLVLEFSGAAGTLATLHKDKAMQCQLLLAEKLGLKPPAIAWHTERDTIAEFGSFLALLTSTCAKLALDTKIQMSTEVGEVSEPYVPHRGSSSTMPQKRNPISCAYITAMNATVRQLSTSLFEAMIEDFERSTGPWEIEWIVLPQICTLAHAILVQTYRLIDGIEVHPDAMARNLEITHGAIVSEAAMMELGKTIGRSYAHDLVYDLCRKAQLEDRLLVDLLDDHPEVKLDREQLEKLCDPANHLGLSIEMTERVLSTS
jgi:3-carboxy-cis,cis-muconate cycloisomerase